jgi:hypothetical protein
VSARLRRKRARRHQQFAEAYRCPCGSYEHYVLSQQRIAWLLSQLSGPAPDGEQP